MSALRRSGQGFAAGLSIGTLGVLIGLGGAEFRLPVLVGVFRLTTLEADIFNKSMSLVVVGAALPFRGWAVPFDQLALHLHVALNLLAGSLIGAWWAAGFALAMPRRVAEPDDHGAAGGIGAAHARRNAVRASRFCAANAACFFG